MFWVFFVIFSAVFVAASIVYFGARQKEIAQKEAEKKAKKEAEKNSPAATKNLIKKEETESLAIALKRKEANSYAKEYIRKIYKGILEKAKAGEYTIKNSKRVITADISWPFLIYTTVSDGTNGHEHELNVTMDDTEKFNFFMESLNEMCARDNISCVPMAKGDCAYSARTPNSVTEIEIPGSFQESIYDRDSVRKFFRCTCVVANRAVTGKDEV